MTVRNAADALAEAAQREVDEALGAGVVLEELIDALAAYRAALARTERKEVVHLSTREPQSGRYATACFDSASWAIPYIVTSHPSFVTCKLCRRTRSFKEATR